MQPLHAHAVDLLLWARQAGYINHLLDSRHSAAAAQQHGTQQQMRAVSK